TDQARRLPPGRVADWQFRRELGGGEIWAQWTSCTLLRAVMRLHLPRAELAYADRAPVRLEELSFSGYFEPGPAGRRLLVDSLAVTLDGQRWGEARISLRERPDEQRWELASDRLYEGLLIHLVLALAPLPDEDRAWL